MYDDEEVCGAVARRIDENYDKIKRYAFLLLKGRWQASLLPQRYRPKSVRAEIITRLLILQSAYLKYPASYVQPYPIYLPKSYLAEMTSAIFAPYLDIAHCVEKYFFTHAAVFKSQLGCRKR